MSTAVDSFQEVSLAQGRTLKRSTASLIRRIAWAGLLGWLLIWSDFEHFSSDEHDWCRSLLRTAHLQGAHVAFLFPATCTARHADAYTHLCQELAAHCTALPAEPPFNKRIFCSTDAALGDLSKDASLGKLHDSIALHCTAVGFAEASLASFQTMLPQCFLPRRPAICDGAGLFSSADHTANNTSAQPQPLLKLSQAMLAYLNKHSLVKHIADSLKEARQEPPLGTEHCLAMVEIIREHLAPHMSAEHFASISEGQPFRLHILQSLARAIHDKDRDLPDILAQGVPTGAFDPLPSSGLWTQVQQGLEFGDDLSGPALEHCTGNWTRAEQNPDLLAELIDKEIAQGWVRKFEGTEQDAALHWPSGTAIGKLNLVLAEGKEPRIVLDSSVCGLNPSVHLPERVALPTGADVQRSFLSDDCFAQLCAVSLDFKAAHKCCKVLPKDQGTLLFRHRGALYHYTVCHFGARFSAYWWQRTGSLILRCLHALLCKHQHRAWLYVDDLLLLLRLQEVEVGAALTVALLGALNAPISWKKAQFAQQVVWCGWQFCFASESVELVANKLAKLREQLQALRAAHKVPRKSLEAALGLLNWATTFSKHLRPFMAPLYKDLHSAKGTLHSIAPASWTAFYEALDSSARLARTPTGSWLPRNAQLLEVGALKVHSKADVPQVPPSHKHQWVRLADPTRQEIHLRKESEFVLQWLSLCFAHEQPRSLRCAPLMPCMSTGDAFADQHRMGIGGWLSTARCFVWFSEIFSDEDIRQQWPQLSGSLQPYIGCFETLAQLALAQCTWQLLRSRHARFVLPSASDNTSAESGLNKLFSTAEPLGTFLRLAATWAHLHRVQFQVEHLAGEKNTWADAMSRGRIAFVQHRAHERVRITLAQLASASHSVTLQGHRTDWPGCLVKATSAMLR